jgi:hypothetical protein
MNLVMQALSLSMFACCASSSWAQGQTQQLLSDSTLEGQAMAVTRTRLTGDLITIVSQYQAAWNQAGPAQRSRMGEWELLSRPHARGIELLQFREHRGKVEVVSSVLPLSVGVAAKSLPAKEHSHFLRALQLPAQMPVLAHKQDHQLALNTASQLAMPPASAFDHVRTLAKQQEWRIEFEHFDAKRGGVLLLKGPLGERVSATLHAHQLGTALVVQESRVIHAQERQ